MLERDLSSSIYETISKKYRVALDHADETLELTYADSYQAELLRIPEGGRSSSSGGPPIRSTMSRLSSPTICSERTGPGSTCRSME